MNNQWGRAAKANIVSFIGILYLLVFAPLMVLYFYVSCIEFKGSLLGPFNAIWASDSPFSAILSLLPPFSFQAFMIFLMWFLLQLGCYYLPDFLHRSLPKYRGGICKGSVTPAGYQLNYRINGLQAWFISHGVILFLSLYFGLFSLTIIFDNWGSLFWILNILGFLLAIFAYVKAYTFPSHPEDRKFSGNIFYDFYMGIELNPRIRDFDFKLFFNGRPGIIAWTLINISFAAAQYQMYGKITNSMILVNILQGIYVLYFFWNEAWYLKTIDIHHDHFGWMLAWGDLNWLPYMYTLQGLYLVVNPVELSTPYALFVLGVGILGYVIFHTSNKQKELFRNEPEQMQIWGKKANFIEVNYVSLDGNEHRTKLLTSGWWGIGRHMNYTGDLILSLSYSLACGFGHILPYFYFFFLATLLIHRTIRDEKRCSAKYGSGWKEYCNQVPYRLIPGLF